LGSHRRAKRSHRRQGCENNFKGECVMNKQRVSIAMMFAVVLLIATPADAKTKEQKQADVLKGVKRG